jgi:hypothetical protein
MNGKKWIVILLMAGTTTALAAPASAPAPGPITVESLMKDMTDLKRLAKLPNPPYTTKQFSSYDRDAKSPSENWFANKDRGQFLAVEEKNGRKENVMMDTDGPGAIVRIWSANPAGVMRIYLDGSEKPTLEGPMKEFMSGEFPGLPAPLAVETARGFNVYFPIPYAKHCKVTCETTDVYYHVNYRTYPAKTEVKTFEKEDLERLSQPIKELAEKLSSPMKIADPQPEAPGTTPAEFDLNVNPGEEKGLRDVKGPGAVMAIWAVLQSDDLAVAARGLLLSMTFDEEETVSCPFGDFFGMAPGLQPYESLPMGVAEKPSVYPWTHWFMPYESRMRCTVKNYTNNKIHLHGVFTLLDKYKWDDKSLLFHAKWRIEREIPSRPFIDWTHLEVTGQGRFVGGMLNIINPAKNWWGEGDEKIYVDGEKFPSTFGTGSEDYYGYAWGSPERFTHAYHNQPHVQGPSTYGDSCVNRWHILDDIPFTKEFKFDMENWAWPDKINMTRAAISYWYARPESKDTFKPISAADLKYEPLPPYQPYRVRGVIEGELLKPTDKTDGEVTENDVNDKFSGEAQLRWSGAKQGSKMSIPFEVAEDGKQHVLVHLAKAADYAQVQLSVNDKKAGEVIDLYSKALEPSGELDLGEFDLKKGPNKLSVEIIGKNAAAKDRMLFGLDYIRLK